ncbi:hypothetical protein [Rubripirellula lacrimiformis]|nr:hypothetical protein [Rubripirellula lacrimiformis]
MKPGMRRNIARGTGTLFWAAVLAMAGWGLKSDQGSSSAPIAKTMAMHWLGAQDHVIAADPTGQLKVHDPVFYQDAEGGWSQIGYVESDSVAGDTGTSADSAATVAIAWNSRDIPPSACRLELYRSSGRLEDVIAVMLPDQQRQKMIDRIKVAMAQHGDQLTAAYLPLVQRSLQASLPVIEDEFRLSVGRHRDEVDSLLGRWNDQVLEDRLIPMARREILPIVRKHGEPQAEAIGRELWDKASLWRFGWRAVYDRSPLPKKDLLQEEWDRFVQEQAVPVFESHMDEIADAVQQIVIDVAGNPNIRSELSEVAGQIAADPETRDLVRTILKETFVENQQLRMVWTEIWTGDEARSAFDLTSDRLEPVARQIGDDLFGTREGGINPNFARVLRNQILGKDRRWIVARAVSPSDADATTDPPRITMATETMPYPIVHLADPKN